MIYMKQIHYLLQDPKRTLLLILFVGFILRLLGMIHITLSGDFLLYWLKMGELFDKGLFPLLGPTASSNPNFHFGPLYFYLLAIPYFLGDSNYYYAIFFFSLLSTFSIYVLYRTCKQMLSEQLSMRITALYALSYFMIFIGNYPINSFLVPFFTILSMYCMTQILHNKYHFFAILLGIFGLLIQAHYTAMVISIVFLLFIPVRKIPWQYYLVGILSFLLVNIPWLIADFTSNHAQITEGLRIVNQSKNTTELCDFGYWLSNHGNGETCFAEIRNTLFVFRMFSLSLFTTQNTGITIGIIGMLLWSFVRLSFPYKKFFFSWIVLTILFFLLYRSNVYIHYFLSIIPLPFILFVLLLDTFEKQNISYKRIGTLIFASVLTLNVLMYLYSLQFVR